MKKLILLAAFFAYSAQAQTVVIRNGSNPCQNPGAVLRTVTGNTSGTTAVQVVALAANQKIFLCSVFVVGTSGTTPTFSLVQGTGSNCGTGQTVLVPAFATTASSLIQFAGSLTAGVAGNALCYLDSGTTPVQAYTITYVQQ